MGIRLTGTLHVALPPAEAFTLFTPRGEERWVPDWKPHFPAPTEDDTEPGTVFETHAHGEPTTWVVTDRTPGRHIRYARVTPGSRAGTVTVTLDDAPSGGSRVTVTYDLTALTPEGERELHTFAAGYQDFLTTWERAIQATL